MGAGRIFLISSFNTCQYLSEHPLGGSEVWIYVRYKRIYILDIQYVKPFHNINDLYFFEHKLFVMETGICNLLNLAKSSGFKDSSKDWFKSDDYDY